MRALITTVLSWTCAVCQLGWEDDMVPGPCPNCGGIG